MVKWSLFYVVLCFAMPALAQVDNLKKDTVTRTNTLPMPPPDLPQSKNSGVMGFGKKPPIALYKIVTAQRDTTHLDTALSIKKEYKFNYLRRDNFGLLPFSNVGQTYNALTFQFNKKNLKPLFAAQSHHYFYRHTDDIHYYNVPTPLTEIYFKTAFEQGQQLDAFFTVNTSEQFNFSMGYKGLRSLGQYQHILTSTGNFIFTTNYGTKNGRYRLRAHLAAQDNLNQENGGLAATSVPLFVDNDPEFEDRARLDVVFENGENKLEGLRFYGDMEYDIVRKKDSARHNALTLGTALSFEDKFYEWRQTTAVGAFGESFKNENLRTKTKLEDFNAKAYARFHHGFFGAIGAFINYNDYNYGYSSVLNLSLGSIVNRLKGNLLQAGANYKKTYRGFQLQGQGAVTLSGGFNASYLSAGAGFALDGENKVAAYVKLHSVAPNFNFLLNQSDYVNYNWQNNFNNVKTQELGFTLKSKKLLNTTVTYTGIDGYTYFAIDTLVATTPKPYQATQRVDYLKIRAEREFTYKRFGLANTLLFQQVFNGGMVLNVPQIVTRNTLYYKDEWFKKALQVQTGVTFNYFTKYQMNGYDPVLAEFYVQNDSKIGGFPLLDLFFNAKVRQTRIFFKWEHVNQLFNGVNRHFSAPGYPYRDAVVRFGLVWDFFL